MAIAIATAQRLLSLDPLNEVGHQALMHLYAGEARQDLALRQYETCRDRLRRELDVAPEPATEALHGEILARRSGTGSEAAASLYGSPAAAMVGSQIVRSDRPAIAVLPFVNQSGDPAQAYLSDGITEDIITELSRYRLLLIIARSSSFQFGGSAVNIAAVRRKLGVRYVVEGSMQDRNQRPGHGAAHRYKGIEAEQCFARAVALDANYVHALGGVPSH